MPNSYRIRTQVGVDKYINVNLDQDFEFLEILSLKILTTDLYTRFCSDYGVVVGRVLVNGGFGVPNARVSVFLPLEEGDELNPVIRDLYPYQNLSDRNLDGYRYNLLPSAPSYSKHVNTGTFPTREDALLNQSWIEVYDKYYRFTVKTNESGDFMIFGVPTGDQTLVMDVDLSDIGCFSLNPQDLIIQGVATAEQVNGSQFKSSTNLDELPQIQNLNFNVDVRPLWGDEDQCQIGITRVDFDLTKLANIKVQPSAVFMGSIMSTTDEDAVSSIFSTINTATGLSFGSVCKPKNNTGNLCELISGPGQILAIRQTIFADEDGLPILEPYSFADNGKVIDDNGAYVINVPMNLDYVTTDEFGNQFISNDPKIGIPTKGKYRFKMKWVNEQGLSNSYVRASYLVPNVKEHGWFLGSQSDPLTVFTGVEQDIVYPAGTTTEIYTAAFNQGVSQITTENVESYSITINGVPYYENLNSILLNNGDAMAITIVPIDASQQSIVSFTYYVRELFDLLRSYSFSLDWSDYVDPLSAINCEDSFYEFDYNKVYTTALFIDRYKNGVGRAKHLGIKEIDDRSCKTTTNTYPVNDIIRNFDFLFFAFNLLINILTPVFIFVLFMAHFAYWILELINEDAPQLSIRLSLPMINYPECTACDCNCNTDDSLISVLEGSGMFAPINSSDNFNLDNTTLVNLWQINVNGTATDDLEGGDLNCGNSGPGPNHKYSSIESLVLNGVITSNVGQRSRRDLINTMIGYDYTTSETNGISLISTNLLLPGSSSGLGDLFLRRAPQTFLISASKDGTGDDPRYWAFPLKESFAQKLNSFNLRDKFFNNPLYPNNPQSQSLQQQLTQIPINRVQTTVNPNLGSQPFYDQLMVIFAEPGTLSDMGIGQLVTFQNPNISPSNILLTGATENQFGTFAVTGHTTLGQQTKVIDYADYNNFNSTTPLQSTIEIIQNSKYGNTGVQQEEDYLRYQTDLEYFQVVTGLTVSDFGNLSNFIPQYFPKEVLNHFQWLRIPNCGTLGSNNGNSFDLYEMKPTRFALNNQGSYEVIFLTRGVDPNTDKQTIRYDLSLYFGITTPNTITIEGSYYLNQPIQTSSSPTKPKTHTGNNQTTGLYFPSFTFTITPTSVNPNNYTAFTSTMPYYYLCPDELFANSSNNSYTPSNVVGLVNNYNMTAGSLYISNPSYLLPQIGTSNGYGLDYDYYYAGGSYIATNNNTIVNENMRQKTNINGQSNQSAQYFGNSNNNNEWFYKTNYLYSPGYLGYYLTSQFVGGLLPNPVGFTDSTNIIMRSDRIPTSTNIQTPSGSNPTSRTMFGLHQNTNFSFYRYDETNNTTVINPIFDAGSVIEVKTDQNTDIGDLLDTLDCNGMVSLQCYSGSGTNIGVNTDCDLPPDRVKNGCYCLLNPNSDDKYLFGGAFESDLQLLLEWKARFTITFAACRGVFAQVFQNNWVNGNLYMPAFLKRTSFNLQGDASYQYCKDIAVFNPFSNSFFYRSSPYNDSSGNFVGKNKPPTPLQVDYGYNDKQILFPTTVVDLGPRDSFIKEICCSGNFGSYYADQLKSTSSQDNSDIIQIGFLSRIIDNTTIQSLLPNNNDEGVSIEQFFNNTRGGSRIDGDFSQMLSINSEWKILPFVSDIVNSSDQIFIGKETPSPSSKPVFGVFFNQSQDSLRYRKIMSPGVETYQFTPVLVEEDFGYPKSQVVPFYKWKISSSSVIFGTENNNWFTNTPGGSFFTKKYQDLDFVAPNEKYTTTTTKLGYITNYYSNGTTNPNSGNVTNGVPGGNPVVVGAPYHFYFGLNVGKTALDIFYKLYVEVQD